MSTIRVALFLSFAEKYTSLLISVVSTVILARLLNPAETGLYSVASGMVNIAQELRDFGVANYLLQEMDLTRDRQASALGISVGLGCVMAALFAASAAEAARLFGEPRLQLVIWILCPCFLLVAFASVGQAKLHRQMNFRASLWIGIAASLIHAVTSVVLVLSGYGAMGLAWAAVFGIATHTIGNFLYLPGDLLLVPSLKHWKDVVRFGMFATGGQILEEMGQRLPELIVGRSLGLAAAGLYSRANGLTNLFQQAVMNALTPVVASGLAQLSRDQGDMGRSFLRCLEHTTVVAWPCLGMIAVLAWPLIHIAIGDQWLPAVPAAQILCLCIALWVVGRLSTSLFAATGRVRRLLFVQLVAVPTELAALSFGAQFSIEMAAIGFGVGCLVFAALSVHHVNRAVGTNWREVLFILLKNLLVTACSLVVPLGVMGPRDIAAEAFWAPSLLASIGGVASWAICLFLVNHPLIHEIRTSLNRSYQGILNDSRHRT